MDAQKQIGFSVLFENKFFQEYEDKILEQLDAVVMQLDNLTSQPVTDLVTINILVGKRKGLEIALGVKSEICDDLEIGVEEDNDGN